MVSAKPAYILSALFFRLTVVLFFVSEIGCAGVYVFWVVGVFYSEVVGSALYVLTDEEFG